MSKVKSWCRANAMLVISLLAAVVTAFFVPPDRDYLGYYDLKTLACLFCVLAVVGALRDLHIFSALSQRMVHTFSTVRGVCTALVVITMFGSMLLTNDTALLTFLPLGWFVLSSTGQEKHAALLFILQNCAANLCGMITPFGNPQNLYLFSYYGLSTKTFFSAMLPPFILSAVLILFIWQVSAEIRMVPWDKRRANSMWTASIRARLPEKVKKAAKVANNPQSTVFSACRSNSQSARTMTVKPRT